MSRDRLHAAALRAALGVLLATAALFVAGCGTGDEVAAEVGGVQYTVEDLNSYLSTPDDEPIASRSDTAVWLSRWVFFSAFETEMAQRGVPVTNAHEAQAVAQLTETDPTFIPGAGGGDVLIHQQAIVIAALDWSDSEASAASAEAQPEPLRFLCSKHILVASAASADGVLQRLDAGEPFGLLAIELSQDPGSGSLGGELGCAPEGSFVPEFEDAAYAVAPGEVVVSESTFGFHVIEVISSGPPTADSHPQIDVQSLGQMASEAEQQALVAAESGRQERQADLLRDVEAATIARFADQVTIHDRYGVWDPVGFQVVLDPAT